MFIAALPAFAQLANPNRSPQKLPTNEYDYRGFDWLEEAYRVREVQGGVDSTFSFDTTGQWVPAPKPNYTWVTIYPLGRYKYVFFELINSDTTATDTVLMQRYLKNSSFTKKWVGMNGVIGLYQGQITTVATFTGRTNAYNAEGNRCLYAIQAPNTTEKFYINDYYPYVWRIGLSAYEASRGVVKLIVYYK